MQRRQAILLFVLALVAGMLAVSIAGGPADDNGDPPAPSTPPPSERGNSREDSVQAAFNPERPSTRRVDAGTRVQLEVEVPAPGQVELRGLGLNAFAVPGTPARFDVFPSEPGRYEAQFIPVDGDPARAGTLVVE